MKEGGFENGSLALVLAKGLCFLVPYLCWARISIPNLSSTVFSDLLDSHWVPSYLASILCWSFGIFPYIQRLQNGNRSQDCLYTHFWRVFTPKILSTLNPPPFAAHILLSTLSSPLMWYPSAFHIENSFMKLRVNIILQLSIGCQIHTKNTNLTI